MLSNVAATVYATQGSIDAGGAGITVRGSLFPRRVRVAEDVTLVHQDPGRL
jgi:hypothetical protein